MILSRNAVRLFWLTSAFVLIIIYKAVYIIPESHVALRFRFGGNIDQYGPGFAWKIPFIESLVVYDKRVLVFVTPIMNVALGDRRLIDIDVYSQFRIIDHLKFNRSVGTVDEGRKQLGLAINNVLQRELGKAEFPDLLDDEKREKLLYWINYFVMQAGTDFGIKVLDVQIGRVGLSSGSNLSVYEGMRLERQIKAKEIRAKSFKEADQIKSNADKARAILLAEADLKSRLLRNEGDADAGRLYAEAFKVNVSFYTFYRAMQIYRNSIASSHPVVILSPKSEIMKYFNGSLPKEVER